jgi:hypothetical protein
MATPASRRRPAADAGTAAAADAMRVLLALAVLYGAMSYLVYRVIHMRHVAPLGPDAPPVEFSEGRVLQHLSRLAVDIPGRQVRLLPCVSSLSSRLSRSVVRCDD